MWNRKELKARGKAAFKANYGRSVIAAILLAIAVAGAAAGTGASAGSSGTVTSDLPIDAETQSVLMSIAPYIVGAILGVAAVATLIRILILNPLEIGCQNFFLRNASSPAELGELKRAFTPSYGRNLLALFLRDLFLALWTALCVIPGLIKMYSYRLTPYILADYPYMKATEAITLSRKMMNGHKWNAFVLDLSFIGWYLLDALTLGILGIFYVHPYVDATNAELYLALKSENI